MENQEYLNQISSQVAAPQPGGKFSRFLRSRFTIVGIIAVVGFILIAIVGSVLGGNKGGAKANMVQLSLHLGGTMSVINEYQPSVKSSTLRSSSASLSSILLNTKSELDSYIGDKYGAKATSDNKLAATAKLEQDSLSADLFEAKINGNLDRVYAHKMAYEIAMFMSEEAQIYKSTSNETLLTLLDKSYSSLEKLYNDFNDFSETK